MTKERKGENKDMKELQNVLTDNGNLKAEVAKAIKAQAVSYLTDLGFDIKPNGRLAKVVATADGKDVTVNLDVAIGYDTDFSKKEKAPKAVSTSEPINVPELF